MKNFTSFRSLLLAASLAFTSVAFTSCEDNDEVTPELPAEARGPYDQKGVFVINEGNYGTPNASISFQSDSTGKAPVQEIFSKANDSRPLGDVALDLDFVGDQAYITVNNSNKIEVVNAYTLTTEAVIESLKQPRYLAVLNESKAYVTEWIKYGEPGQVSVIDLKTNRVVKSIPVGPQPEELYIVNNKVYVAVSGSNVVSVINTSTDAKEQDITVSDAPTELRLDRHNRLWVLSKGHVAYNSDWTIDYSQTTAGALAAINTASNTIERTFTFGSNESMPGHLTINPAGDKLYFNYNGSVFAQSVDATALSSTGIISKTFYGMDVDPETGYIYGGEQAFTGSGTVFVYRPDGTQVTSFKAGIGPNGFVFN